MQRITVNLVIEVTNTESNKTSTFKASNGAQFTAVMDKDVENLVNLSYKEILSKVAHSNEAFYDEIFAQGAVKEDM